jgi:uncharacterized protein (TIGR02677 family)
MPDLEDLPEAGPSDPWAAHLPGQEWIPAYLVSRFAAQYRVLVEVLLEAQDTSLTGLSFEDVETRTRAQLSGRFAPERVEALLDQQSFNLDGRLEQLVKWGVLTRWQDAARTGEDFLRRRDRYQLTPQAARLHAFWTLQADSDEEAAADLTLAPRAIHDRLAVFAEAVQDRHYPAAAAEYQQVISLHHGMAVAARTWQRNLAHALAGGPDAAKQEILWRTLQSYVGMWGEQVDVHTPRIAGLIDQLEPYLSDRTWQACARAALAEDAAEETVRTQAARWASTWVSLKAWFVGSAGTDGEGQARRLRRQLRDLVAPWARNMHILMDTGGAVTRRAELLRLAQAIERAPDEETAWRMWDTAVGVFPARHLLLPANDPEDLSRSWKDADPAPVEARFLERGPKAAVGRRPRAFDYSTGRAAARRARVAGQAARFDAEASLRSRSGSRIGEWEQVSEGEFDLLLELFAIARKDGPGSRSAVTGDGRWRVSLSAPDGVPATTAIKAPRGRLVTRDWRFVLEFVE